MCMAGKRKVTGAPDQCVGGENVGRGAKAVKQNGLNVLKSAREKTRPVLRAWGKRPTASPGMRRIGGGKEWDRQSISGGKRKNSDSREGGSRRKRDKKRTKIGAQGGALSNRKNSSKRRGAVL